LLTRFKSWSLLRNTRGWIYDQKQDVAVWPDQGYEIDLKLCRISPDECMDRINRLTDRTWCTAACLSGFMSVLRQLNVAISRSSPGAGRSLSAGQYRRLAISKDASPGYLDRRRPSF